MVDRSPQLPMPRSYGEFWELYLHEHQQPRNRWLHAIGTWSAWLVIIVSIVTQNWWLLLLAPVVGYGMAWFGHLCIEKNKPLSMRFPVRSLLSDLRLAVLMLIGRDPLRNLASESTRREDA